MPLTRAGAARAARQFLVESPLGDALALCHGPQAHVQYWEAFVQAGGLVLSPRDWAAGPAAVAAVAGAIGAGLRHGWGADKAFYQFLMSGAAAEAAADPYGPWQQAGPAQERMIKLFVREMNDAHRQTWKAQQEWGVLHPPSK